MEEAGEEVARAPRPHWALVGLLWVLAGALCVLGPNGRVLASLAKPVLTPKAEAASMPQLPPLAISPGNGTTNVMPSTIVTVSSRDRIERVLLADATGAAVTGQADPTGRLWKSTVPLKPGRQYQVTVDVLANGKQHRSTTSSFSTVPGKLVSAALQPANAAVVGVGMPIIVKFSAPIKNQSEILKGITAWASSGREIRAKWMSPYELHLRPETYWTQGDQVTANVDIEGLDAGNNIFGTGHQRISFGVGVPRISTVDVVNHTMTVTENGKVLRTFPISAGKPKYPTMNGIHVVKGKAKTVVMDSSTVGIPRNSSEGYYLKVNYAVQFTLGGSFVHSAPWSVAKQGVDNVSHGCINASPANAQWYFGMARMGDIVQVTGSPRPPTARDGSADWNTKWTEWVPQLTTPGHTSDTAPRTVS